MYAANFLDFRDRYGLLVCDDRERFQRSQRQSRGRNQAFEKVFQSFVMLRLCRKAITVRNLANLDSMLSRTITLNERVQGLLKLRMVDVGQRFVNRVEPDGFLCEIDDSLK